MQYKFSSLQCFIITFEINNKLVFIPLPEVWVIYIGSALLFLTLLVSSLAAAQSVESIGNKHTISKIKILKTLENILK